MKAKDIEVGMEVAAKVHGAVRNCVVVGTGWNNGSPNFRKYKSSGGSHVALAVRNTEWEAERLGSDWAPVLVVLAAVLAPWGKWLVDDAAATKARAEARRVEKDRRAAKAASDEKANRRSAFVAIKAAELIAQKHSEPFRIFASYDGSDTVRIDVAALAAICGVNPEDIERTANG